MHGCGTLASPSGFDLGNRKKMSATFNGKQHLLPSHPKHDMAGKGESKLMKEEVEELEVKIAQIQKTEVSAECRNGVHGSIIAFTASCWGQLGAASGVATHA